MQSLHTALQIFIYMLQQFAVTRGSDKKNVWNSPSNAKTFKNAFILSSTSLPQSPIFKHTLEKILQIEREFNFLYFATILC